MRATRYTAPLLAALMAAGAASAETCSFTLECFEGEPCQDTAFTLEIAEGRLITDAETIPVSSGGSATVGVFVGYTASAFHMLTRETEGEARYVTHIFDGIVQVSYLGRCSG